MKKIILLLCLTFALAVGCNTKANAQIAMYRNTDTTSSGVALAANLVISTAGRKDSLHDANTLYSFYTIPGKFNTITKGSKIKVTFNVTKLTGTGTARVYIQGSSDGKVWRNLNAGMVGTDGINADTLAIAAATVAPGVNYEYFSADGQAVYRPAINAGVFYVNAGEVEYLRAKIVGTGTQLTVYQDFEATIYE